jgi:hypothetical protein
VGKPLSEVAEGYIDALLQVHRALNKREEVVSRAALKLARDLRGMAYYVDRMLSENKELIKPRMGRHARADERVWQYFSDFDCYATTEQFHHEGLSWTDAIEKAAVVIKLSPEAVRKARSRIKSSFRTRF